MSELKLSLITIGVSAGILILAKAIFGATMLDFIVGMMLYLVMKREVRDMFGTDED